jgi:hypothetical protein
MLYPRSPLLNFDAVALLGAHLAVSLDSLDVLVRLESGDGVVVKGHTVLQSDIPSNEMHVSCSLGGREVTGLVRGWRGTYEKPLMSLYSCPILPPWSWACFLALRRCYQLLFASMTVEDGWVGIRSNLLVGCVLVAGDLLRGEIS